MQQAIEQRIRSAWVGARYVAFYAKWSFIQFFVIPAVTGCLLLAMSSGFSFASLSRDAYQIVAQYQQLPAAPDGTLNVRACIDGERAARDGKLRPPQLCKHFATRQESIDVLAEQTASYLWYAYLTIVIVGLGAVWTFGIFASSWRALQCSLAEVRNDKGALATAA
ncbi:hypothetical protein [Burkholderia sp. Ac-20365]|uniref:hypothetical protein n=1 Tax=Burkholderia sp. Ac-20365 TaxID=2703897 RepID=UPI00197C8CD1|nr:hypothetical protein [Burkholderia sp. Ac-20365]MBN3761298.1 hypothetical protein [Burkholderia sp. Ac-20365]